MRNLFFLIATIILMACEQPVNHDFNPTVTDQVTGIAVEYRDGIEYPIEDIVNTYNKVQQCMGMAAYPGPNIIIYDSIEWTHGYTYYNPPLIIIEDDGLINDNVILLQHEFVHYILLMNGTPDNENTAHSSILFYECGFKVY